MVRVEYLYFLLHNRLIENFWDFMASCSLFLLLSTFFGGYDLYIIALIYPWSRSEARKRTKCAGVPSSGKKEEYGWV